MRFILALAALAVVLGGCNSIVEKVDRDRRTAWLEAHPNAPDRVRRAVEGGMAYVGMPADAAEASWGPAMRYRTWVDGSGRTMLLDYGRREMWIRNGRVSEINW